MSRGGIEDSGPNHGSGEGDDIDKATLIAQMFTDSSVEIARAKSKPEQVVGADGEYPTPDCVDCGEPIVTARLQMGKIRCIDCQRALEYRGRMH